MVLRPPIPHFLSFIKPLVGRSCSSALGADALPGLSSQINSAIWKDIRESGSNGTFVDYKAAYAMQTCLISEVLKNRKASDVVSPRGWLLFMQHRPVYTMGRRAKADHLLWLEGEGTKKQVGSNGGHAPSSNRVEPKNDGSEQLLGIDRTSGSDYHHSFLESLTLSQAAGEGAAPAMTNPENGAAVIRIDRGGDVTYHGPGQLTVYPIIDLKLHKMDLAWYLGSLEDLLIKTLQHFGIDSTRDSRGTGVWVGDRKIAQIGIGCRSWVTKVIVLFCFGFL